MPYFVVPFPLKITVHIPPHSAVIKYQMIHAIDVVCSLLPPLNQKGHSSIAFLPCTSIRPHAEKPSCHPPLLNVGGTHDRFTVSFFLLLAITPLVTSHHIGIPSFYPLVSLTSLSLTRHMLNRNHRVYTCIYS